MARRTKAGQFSPVSLVALNRIAKLERKHPKLLLAYLALARHTTMNDLDGSGPNRYSGAGAKKITEVALCGREYANTMLDGLVSLGLIVKAPQGLSFKQARWAMCHTGTVNIPHALIDGTKGRDGKDQEGITRLLRLGASDEVITCAIMLLVNCYAEHDLDEFGGINPQLMWREWKHQAKEDGDCFRVTCEPGSYTASKDWIELIVSSMGGKVDDKGNSSAFWSAFELLKGKKGEGGGLFYEVVTAWDDQTPTTRVPIRLNDYHAATGEGEASLIADVPSSGFYTNKENDRGDPEKCWFLLPTKPQKVTGVWRLRFRCATSETAAGLECDGMAVEMVRQQLAERGTLFALDW
jgi:hypothetical protein